MKRIVSIDVLRGASLALMIIIHCMIAYGDEKATESTLHFFFDDVIGNLGATWFLLMVGMSQVLSAGRKKGAGEWNLMKTALLRGAYLFAAGLLQSALAFGPSEMWDWDILPLIGSATVALYFCRFLPSWLILVISAALMFMAPWLRSYVDFTVSWGGELVQSTFFSGYLAGIYFEPVSVYKVIWSLDEILKGYFVSGTFPIFPWLAFPLIGFVIGRRMVSGQIKQDLPFLHLMGLALILLGTTVSYAGIFRPLSSPISDYIAPLCLYPNSITLFYLQTGVGLVLFASLYYYYDGREDAAPSTGVLVVWFKRLSRYSLTVYFFHWLVICWPLWIIYFVTGRFLGQDVMGAFPAFLLGLAVVALFLMCLKVWEGRGGKFTLEWGLRRITEGIGKPGRVS
ncbi:MAG: DUF1624 domain-containing protein [Deltaproteobacteria bacterium]|nr:DUF1624 domain-containing protein [Deltaproteobacteria bacterium]